MHPKATSSVIVSHNLEAPPAMATASSDEELRRELCVHQADLASKAFCLTRDREEANDLVQDTLVRAMRSMPHFRAGTNMRAWLMKIMTNLFIDRCRKAAGRPSLVPLLDDGASIATPAAFEDESPLLCEQISFEQLQSALQEIDPIFRNVYELRVTKQLSYEQISIELKIPIGTVGARLSRARAHLRRILTPAEWAGTSRSEEAKP